MPKPGKHLEDGYEYVPGYVRRRKGAYAGGCVLVVAALFMILAVMWMLNQYSKHGVLTFEAVVIAMLLLAGLVIYTFLKLRRR
jgi:cytochrome c oxidase subunit IV